MPMLSVGTTTWSRALPHPMGPPALWIGEV